MKKMKKVLATMLAATMVMSMSMTAFADEADDTPGYTEGEDGTEVEVTQQPTGKDEQGNDVYADIVSLDLNKMYKLTNDNMNSPIEDFTFKLSTDEILNSEVKTFTSTLVPTFDVETDEGTSTVSSIVAEGDGFYTIGTISYGLGDATFGDGTEGTVNINLPDYDHVGIYKYVIEEQSNFNTENKVDVAGVTYDKKKMYLKVTVIEQNGEVRVAALHYEDEETGNKTGAFVNEYSAGDLSISKTVTGNMGDKEKYFQVVVKLIGEENKDYSTHTVTIEAEDDGEEDTIIEGAFKVTGASSADNPEYIEINKECTLYLKDTDTITIENIPYGVTYTVEEKDYTTGENAFEEANYDAADYDWADEEKKIDSALDTVGITNNKEGDVDTGIILDSAPYVLLLALAVVGMFAVVNKKREEEF